MGRKGSSGIEIEPLQRKMPLTVLGALRNTDPDKVSGLLNTDEKDNSQKTISHVVVRSHFPWGYTPDQGPTGYPRPTLL